MSFVKVRSKNRHSRRSEAPARFYVSEVDLLCKNSCGFYGNSEWGGYCSKCKEAGNIGKARAKPLDFLEKTKSKVSRSVSDVGESMKTTLQSAKSSLPRIDERRKLASPSFESRRVFSFVKQAFRKIEQSLNDEQTHNEDLSNIFKDIYQSFKDKLEHNFNHLSSDDVESLADKVEQYLCTRLYRKLTYNGFSVEEDKDLSLQKKIRQMNWITPEMIDCVVNEKLDSVQKLMVQAISNLIEIDSKRIPQDKLELIVETCKLSFQIVGESVENSGDTGGSADDLLPTLIYILLRANPPRLWSNIMYITHFANPARSESGESGYYFTNFRIAIEFIEKMSGKDLDLTEEQFNSYMSGELFPLNALRNGHYQSEGLQVMYNNLKTLEDMQLKYEELESDTVLVEKEIQDFNENIAKEVKEVLAQYPMKLKGPNLDFLGDAPQDLPPPLVPTVVGPHSSGLSQVDEAFFVGGKKIPVIHCEANEPSEVDAFGMSALESVIPKFQ
nr:EOG090X03G5 [Artemia franciscana]